MTRSERRIIARLFDADRTDEVLPFEEALRRRIAGRQLLWIDVEGRLEEADVLGLAERLHLAGQTRHRLLSSHPGPVVAIHGPYVHLRVAAASESEPGTRAGWLDIVATRSVVVSAHDEPLDMLRNLQQRVHADAPVGALDGGVFAASLLGSVVTGYLRAVDAIEDVVDELDGRALRATLRDDRVLGDLVAVRRRIARLRRLLTDQREVFAVIASAEFGSTLSDDVPADFRVVADRYDAALGSVEDTRDLLLGSFDVFMTRTAQRTNEVMKVLALATVLLLPGSLLAGLLGMNVDIPLPHATSSFWAVVILIGILAAGVLIAARMRRWV